MFTTARLADRMPATYNVMIGPALKNTSPDRGDADRTGHGGGAVGSAATDATSDRDPDDQAHPADRVIRADLRGSSQVIGRRGAIEIGLERLGVADDPEGPRPAAIAA